LEQQHVEYAQQQLEKSRSLRQKRNEQKNSDENTAKSKRKFSLKKDHHTKPKQAGQKEQKAKQRSSTKVNKAKFAAADINALTKGQNVNVLLGQKPAPATVIDILKNNQIKARLSSGMELTVD